jgi:uncharacterized protein with ATP-grasp and redox domains
MQFTYECLPCVFKQIHQLVSKAADDSQAREKLLREMLASMAKMNWDGPPTDFSRDQQLIIKQVIGDDADLFRVEKDLSTELSKEIWEEIAEQAAREHDPFEAALRLAIGGNIIDYGIDGSFQLSEARGRLFEVLALPLAPSRIAALQNAMNKAEKIFYVLDNCGEAVFDRLLIEQFGAKITLGVRGMPVLNDVTRRELASSGLAGYPVVDTGDCTPGVSRRHTAPAFLQAMQQADLVVAKGQGNFETMDDYDRPIFFLFRAKCAVVARHLGGVELGSLQVIGKYV